MAQPVISNHLEGFEWPWVAVNHPAWLLFKTTEIWKNQTLPSFIKGNHIFGLISLFFFRVNIFQGCASRPLRIGTAVLRFPAGILASCKALKWQFIKKLREMGSDSWDWEDIKRGPDQIRWNAKCQLPLFMAVVSRGPHIDILESCGAFCMMLVWTPFFNSNCFKFFLHSLVSLFLLLLGDRDLRLKWKICLPLISLPEEKPIRAERRKMKRG